MLFTSKSSCFDYLIAGLGNPGLPYEKTRHNAGFAAVEYLVEKHGCRFEKHKFDALFTEINIEKNRVLVAKPQTYMNLSGKAIVSLCSFYRIPYDRLIILYDDISLPVGTIRIRRKGSAGGHNGMKDIIELTGTEELMRIKIGVGHKPSPDYDLKDWVLSKLPDDQQAPFKHALQQAAAAAEEIILRGVDSAMNRYSK